MKARFTKNYLSSQRSFEKWINQPPHLSPLPASGARRSSVCSVASSVAEARRALLSVLSVPLSMNVFAACANFRPLCFVPQSAGLLECALPARRVRASSRRFWRKRPLIKKRCEDASHSQSTSRHGGQAVQDAVDAFRPIDIRVISEPSCGNSETEGKAARVAASERG